MKKILSIVLTIVLAVSCLSIYTNAADEPIVIYESEPIVAGCLTTEYVVDILWNDDGTMTLTVHSYATADGTNSIAQLTFNAYILHNLTDLKYVEGSMIVTGQDNDACLQPYEYIDYGDGVIGGVSGGHSQGTYTVGVPYHSSCTWTFEVLAAPGSEIPLWEDDFATSIGYDTCYNGQQYYEGFGPLVTITVPTAEVEPEYTKPATPVAATKAACEACGTEAGVRFLMTVDKTAADYADVTAYGVVIETADGEYKYTANANTKKNETNTAIQYAVVVTGAPAGTEFTATAFLMYGDVEVAGASGAINA